MIGDFGFLSLFEGFKLADGKEVAMSLGASVDRGAFSDGVVGNEGETSLAEGAARLGIWSRGLVGDDGVKRDSRGKGNVIG